MSAFEVIKTIYIIACSIFNKDLLTKMKVLLAFLGKILWLTLRSFFPWGKTEYDTWDKTIYQKTLIENRKQCLKKGQ